MPKLVRKDDRFVETFIASAVAFFRNEMDVCDELSEIVRGGKISQTHVLKSAAVKPLIEQVRLLANIDSRKIRRQNSMEGQGGCTSEERKT